MARAHESPCKTRTVVLDIIYILAQNVVIHTEDCKLESQFNYSVTQMENNICRMCGIGESRRRRGFEDFALEVFYIDFVFRPHVKNNWKCCRRVRALHECRQGD